MSWWVFQWIKALLCVQILVNICSLYYLYLGMHLLCYMRKCRPVSVFAFCTSFSHVNSSHKTCLVDLSPLQVKKISCGYVEGEAVLWVTFVLDSKYSILNEWVTSAIPKFSTCEMGNHAHLTGILGRVSRYPTFVRHRCIWVRWKNIRIKGFWKEAE